MTAAKHFNEKQIWEILETVPDPEIPVLSVVDLGIIRKIDIDGLKVSIKATPTYSGCPAIDVIKTSIIVALESNGVQSLDFEYVLNPVWTTDWISDAGREKLRDYGIAIKERGSVDKTGLFEEEEDIPCPQCGSQNVQMTSYHGSTPCKSLYKCLDCLEPFDYFKCHVNLEFD